jgi:DNA-directed RNA polymerase subunit B
MQDIVNEMGEIIPTITPEDVKDFKIKFNKIWITKPQIIEADGSKRDVYPMEARLRQLSYSASIFLDVGAIIEGIKIGIAQPIEIKLEKTRENLDKYLLPHLGTSPKDRMLKAYTLCKLIKRFLMVSREGIEPNDKDHYMNKKLKLSGDLISDLFRVNLRILINDILYNFQRLVKRGKYTSLKIVIREKLLTSRIQSAMATGTWVGGRKGVSQNIDRINYLSSLSHLQRVVSLLSSTQENFEARALHPTHWGRLCAIETPEGTSIGLRKNMALLCSITQGEVQEDKLRRILEGAGLNPIK